MSQPIERPPHSRIAMPTRSLLQGMEYVNAASTSIKERFDRIRAEEAAKQKQRGLRQVKR